MNITLAWIILILAAIGFIIRIVYEIKNPDTLSIGLIITALAIGFGLIMLIIQAIITVISSL